MQIIITAVPAPDQADPEDSTGLTEQAYEELTDVLMDQGYTDVGVRRADPA
jgi:hypothetical protein